MTELSGMTTIALLWNMIPSILMIVAPILIAAIGGMICERAGIINIALEGLMAFGAFAAALSHQLLEIQLDGISIPFALFMAALTGCFFSLIHAIASITMKANQVISGTGINLLAPGLTVFLCQVIYNQERTQPFKLGMMPFNPENSLFSWMAGIYPTAVIALVLLVLSWFALYKRPWGLRLRSCGEDPQAAAAAGINVVRMRYTAVLVSGILAGLAGGCLVLTQTIQYTANT
ncbi:MAG: ABC transporter permease, partial [Treponema sp.]|nr:ABC transporter permease [Treponema sp.]